MRVSFSYPPCAAGVGRGTMRSMVEGLTGADCPSTARRAVPLPMSFAHREDC
jgi:hypothetical protein